MPASDNTFTFDTSPFMQGIDKIAKGMGAMTKGAQNMAQNVSRGIMNATAKIGLLVGAFGLVRKAIQAMPEIGKTFGMAKEIITKNLLFPLRKAIFPLLQKFLNWVRDNRAMFVKWGQTLANIFHSVAGAIGDIIAMGQKLFDTFLGYVNKVFGTNIQDINDIFNILSFKFAVVFEFLKGLMGPLQGILNTIIEIGVQIIGKVLNTVMSLVSELMKVTDEGNSIFTIFESISKTFGDILNFVAEITSSFVDGFKPHIQPIINHVQKIADAFGSIFKSIFGSNEAMKNWKDIFKFLGDVFGKTLESTFKVFADIVNTIDGIIKSIKGIADLFMGKEMNEDMAKNFVDTALGLFKFFNPAMAAQMDMSPPVNDALITSQGQVIPINSQDDVMTYKPGGPISTAQTESKVVNIDFKGMQVIVQNSTPEEAERFSESLVDSFRRTLTRELEQGGNL